MHSIFQGSTTKAEVREQKRKEQQYKLGVCRIRRKEENQSSETLGSGFVVKDFCDCQYCLISSNKVFPDDNIKSYYLDFKKLTKKKLKTIKLGDITNSTRINRDLYSGLVVITIHPSWNCKKKSIFTYRPFKVDSEEISPNQDLQCYFVDDSIKNDDRQPVFSVKQSTLRQSESNSLQYQLPEDEVCEPYMYGGAILKNDDSGYVAVGAMTFVGDGRQDISPVFFRCSLGHEHCNQEINVTTAERTDVPEATVSVAGAAETEDTVDIATDNTTAQQPTPAANSNGHHHGEEQDVPDPTDADEVDNPNPSNEAARYEDTVPGHEHHNQERNAAVAGWTESSNPNQEATVPAAAATQKESLQPGETNAESLTINPILEGVENTVDAGATETAQQPTPAAISNDHRLIGTGPREVKFFGDLNDTQATEIVDKLGQDAKKLLRRELESGPNDSNLSTKDLILRSKSYRIRKYTDLLADGCRGQAIKTLREALPASKGVVGPLLPINKFIRDVGYTVRSNLTMDLSADDHWKSLAERLEVEHTIIRFHDRRSKNPADEVLRHWEVKAHSTVGVLYDILVEIECPLIADLL